MEKRKDLRADTVSWKSKQEKRGEYEGREHGRVVMKKVEGRREVEGQELLPPTAHK